MYTYMYMYIIYIYVYIVYAYVILCYPNDLTRGQRHYNSPRRRACVQKTAAERKVEHDVKRHFSASLPHPVFWVVLAHVHPMFSPGVLHFAANYRYWMSNAVFLIILEFLRISGRRRKRNEQWIQNMIIGIIMVQCIKPYPSYWTL